jgi:hypothetical protein
MKPPHELWLSEFQGNRRRAAGSCLGETKVRVLIAMIQARRNGRKPPTCRALAKICRCNHTAIEKIRLQLVKLGLVRIEYGPWQERVYMPAVNFIPAEALPNKKTLA